MYLVNAGMGEFSKLLETCQNECHKKCKGRSHYHTGEQKIELRDPIQCGTAPCLKQNQSGNK